jgi:hypothetical protein
MTDLNFDLKNLAEDKPSLCIPRVFNNIDQARIRDIFNCLNIGSIKRIDVIERKNEKGESFKRVFVHFEKWYWNAEACSARRKLIEGKEIKIVYDNPWFWKVSAYRESEKSSHNYVKKEINFNHSKPRIDLDDLPQVNKRQLYMPKPPSHKVDVVKTDNLKKVLLQKKMQSEIGE